MTDAKFVGDQRPPTGPGIEEGVEARVDVEVAVEPVGRAGHQPTDPATLGRADPSDVEQQAPGQSGGERGQRGVGGSGHLGQQRQGVVGVLLDQLGQRLLVDLTDIGRDVVERRVTAQLLAGRGPAVLLGQGLLGIIALEGERRARVAP